MKKMLIYVSSKGNGIGGNTGNNNKFYYMELNGDVVNIRYGRVGTKGQTTSKMGGEREFNKILKAKFKKGYVESEIDLEVEEETINSSGNILELAMEQIKMLDNECKKLVERLVQKNIHNITENTKIKYDIKTGLFKTPLGVVTAKGVNKAKLILDDISEMIQKNNTSSDMFIKKNEEYFTIIPTVIGNLRDNSSFINTNNRVQEQYDICDSLISTIEIVAQEKAKQKTANSADIKNPEVFDITLDVLKDKKDFDRLVKYFEKSKNRNHGGKINSAKIEKIYTINLGKEEKEYRYDLNNQMQLWHGTKVANILSILKSGLLMPKYSPGQATGYMFGQGLYFSDQSTKSLNYCDGMYWNNSAKQDKIYMFVADIAMGNYQVPNSSRSVKPNKGYDSYFAKARQSGVMNNEMIIFNNNQIRLRYLLEISL